MARWTAALVVMVALASSIGWIAPAASGAGRATRLAPDADAAFAKFWAARSPQAAAKAAGDIIKSGSGFDDAWATLRRGRPYAAKVPRGTVQLQRRVVAGDFFYNIEVPEHYDPLKAYQVRVQLHGGVMRRETSEPRRTGNTGALAGAEQIYVIPYAWRDAPWWSEAQEENLDAILDSVKRTYNVDENRIALSGVSDGATAVYYFAMRDTTPFSAFLPLNGFVMVLANDALGLNGNLYPNNLLDKPFFIVNGGLDPLYPMAIVGPYVEHLKKHGVSVTYQPQPGAGHNTAWWPDVREPFETFVRDHPRLPYPDRLTWQTERVDAHNRAHWLVIDKLRAASPAERAAAPLDDVNDFSRELVMAFGVIGSGTRVSRIQAGSNADRLGLRPGDTIASIDGRGVAGGDDLLAALARHQPGDLLVLVVSRDARSVELRGPFQPQEVPAATMPMFHHSRASGRVDLVRTGNAVQAVTRGVAAFTLLLSPDVFDFSQPVTVTVNGTVAFRGRVEKNLQTLLAWAARDNDRTMVFGAELRVAIK